MAKTVKKQLDRGEETSLNCLMCCIKWLKIPPRVANIKKYWKKIYLPTHACTYQFQFWGENTSHLICKKDNFYSNKD